MSVLPLGSLGLPECRMVIEGRMNGVDMSQA